MQKTKKIYFADSDSNACFELTRENRLSAPVFSVNCSEYPNKNLRVNQEETLLLVNDKNKIKVKLMKGGNLEDTDILIDDYWKRRHNIEDLEMVGTDKCLVAVSDGSLNLHHINLVDQKASIVAREYLNRNSQKSNMSLRGKQLQITSISVSKTGKYAVVSTNTDV